MSRVNIKTQSQVKTHEGARAVTLSPEKELTRMAFIDEVINSQENSRTYLGEALQKVNGDPCERVIIITDEQTHDTIIPCWAKYGYIVNIAGYKPSIFYQQGWELIAGWSDKIVNYIYEIEKL